jgi:hypothetical protein
MGSVGMGVDIVGDVGFVYFDKDGEVVIGGASIGIGGNTGATVDAGFYAQNLPTASSVDVFAGWTVNAGVSAGEGLGGGIEVNAVRDPKIDQPVIGGTVNAGVSAKANIPVPPVEFYGNVTHTWLSPLRFNIYDLLGLPRP